MIRYIYKSMKKIEASNEKLQSKVSDLESKVDQLNKKVLDLQNIVNAREQDLRGLSVRISGIPFSDEEKASTDGKFLMKKVYDKLLLPVLNHAKAKNHIERIPSANNTIQQCYRVGAASARTGTGAPPPIVLKFANEAIRLTVLKNKRNGMPSPFQEEKDMGIVRFNISEDLTPPCYKLLKELQCHEEVAKVWTVEGRIRMMLKGSQAVHRVRSVFESVDAILAKASA
jgi:uncharacterized protein YfkK (UPF0435 family)